MSVAVSNEVQPSAVTMIRSCVRSLFMAAARLWIAHRDERILLQASAHQLRDIGIARADIRCAVRSGRVGCR
jgi:uncharacterized protein YjiS (DUF1127 family)